MKEVFNSSGKPGEAGCFVFYNTRKSDPARDALGGSVSSKSSFITLVILDLLDPEEWFGGLVEAEVCSNLQLRNLTSG